MDENDFASLKRAISQVEAYKAGERKGFVVHEPVNIKELRRRVGKTQAEFASTYHLPVGTVRDWEQGKRQPDASARVLLSLIQRDPKRVADMLA
ncbi:MAG: helix-turn-helix domain-containing protein [Novosphingobium sp.]